MPDISLHDAVAIAALQSLLQRTYIDRVTGEVENAYPLDPDGMLAVVHDAYRLADIALKIREDHA